MKYWKMEVRNKRRGRLKQNVPRRRYIVNIRSSWSDYEYKTSRKEIDMNIRELQRLPAVNLKTVKTDDVNINLVDSWSRFFESQGMSHEDAEKQALLTVTQNQTNSNLTESLIKAGYTDDQVKYFLEGRGGADNLMEGYLVAKKKNLMESGK